MAQQFQFQAPQTDINASLARLAQANSQMHDRDLQQQQINNDRDTNTFSNYVGIAGAAIAGIYSGGNPAAISAGYSIGSNVGRAVKGGKANAGEVASAGATLYGVDQDQQQTEAERQQLVAMRNQNHPVSDVGPGDVMGNDVTETASDRYINPALKSPTPFKTALAGIQIANALAPQQTKEITYGDNSTALVTTDAMGHIDKVIGNERRENQAAPKSAKQIWINDSGSDDGGFRPITLTNPDKQIPDLVARHGEQNVLLENPEKAAPQGTQTERMINFLADRGDDRRGNKPISDKNLTLENSYRQILSKPTTIQTTRGLETQPGMSFDEIDKLSGRPAQGVPAPDAANTSPKPLPIPDRTAMKQEALTPAQQDAIQSRAEASSLLDTMETHLSQTGKVQGLFSEVGSYMGTNDEAIQFKLASQKSRLALQSTIKGVPSDKDQALIDSIVPNLTDSTEMARAKINIQRQAIDRANKGELDYLRMNNSTIPKVLEEAGQKAAPNGNAQPLGSATNPFHPASASDLKQAPLGSYFINPKDGKQYRKTRN